MKVIELLEMVRSMLRSSLPMEDEGRAPVSTPIEEYSMEHSSTDDMCESTANGCLCPGTLTCSSESIHTSCTSSVSQRQKNRIIAAIQATGRAAPPNSPANDNDAHAIDPEYNLSPLSPAEATVDLEVMASTTDTSKIVTEGRRRKWTVDETCESL
jgi:hypothetical protein